MRPSPVQPSRLPRFPLRSSIGAPILAFVVAVIPAPVAAEIDCALCQATCKAGGRQAYPDELSPESPRANVRHKSKEAEAAFLDAKKRDPAFGGKDVRAAIAGYRNAVKLDGGSAQYRNHLAAALLMAAQPDEAVYNLEAAVRLAPAEPKYIVNLGYAHHKRGDETRALLYYLRALMLDPRDVRARLFSGYALDILGYRQEAALELKKVLAQDPENDGAKRALVRFGVLPASTIKTKAAEPPAGAPPPLLGAPEANGALRPVCKIGRDGRQACGYHCQEGSDGAMACANTPDGACAMGRDGRMVCSQVAIPTP